MSAKQKQDAGLVPKLRFPEFREAGEWARMPLDAIAKFYKGKGIAKADIDPNGETLCIRYGELYTTYGEVISEVMSKTSLPLSDLFLSCCNDVLIPSSGETKLDIAKASCVMLDDVALGGDLNVLRSDANGIFLSYLLNGSCSTDIAKIAQGDTVVHLYASQLKTLNVAIPKLAEQQKIADCLSSLDDLIRLEAEKLDAIKAHKKGMMQQLFPAEGQTLPKLRFPEFREAGEWRGGQLNDALLSISNGLVLEQGSDVTGYKVTRIETIATGAIDPHRIGLVKTSQDISSYKLKVGDILVSNINSVAHIGKSAFVDHDYDLHHGMNLLRLVVNKSKHHPKFIFYLINTDEIRASLRERANKAVNQASINQTELGRTEVALPLAPEQQKIADCLSALDSQITTQAEKIDALKIHKKGLMQQLFPALDEVPA